MFNTTMLILSIIAFCVMTNEIYRSFKEWGKQEYGE